jgi:hypothetical protein
MKLSFAIGAVMAIGAAAQGAHAAVVISDNFNADRPVVTNWPGDSVFLSIPQPGNVQGLPSVDLVGNQDGFGYLAYQGANNGVSVDLDGSTGSGNNPAGEIQSITSLGTGNYTVSFYLAGNLRGAPNQTTAVSIGGQTIDVTPTSNAQPYTLYTLRFDNASGQVSFSDLGPSNQQGNLLDNIVVTNSVPEPATWALMLVGFGGLGLALRTRGRMASAKA